MTSLSTNPGLTQADSRHLAAAVLQRAVQDARGVECSAPAEALAWLSSKHATIWMDLLDIPQSDFLLRAGWVELAEQALQTPADLTEDQLTCIQLSLQHLYTSFPSITG